MKTMKRFLIVLLLLSSPAIPPAFGQNCVIEQGSTSATRGPIVVGPFQDDTDFKTAETALTIQKADVKISKNGGTEAAASADQGASDAGAPHLGSGNYGIAYNTTDSNTNGNIRFTIKESGALVAWRDCIVVPAVKYAEMVTTGPSSILDFLGQACSGVSVAGSWGKAVCDYLNQPISWAGGQVESGTAQSGSATSITLEAGESATAEFYRYKRIVLMGGTGVGQSAIITAYNQTTKVATTACEGSTLGSWFTNPSSGTTYIILPRNR